MGGGESGNQEIRGVLAAMELPRWNRQGRGALHVELNPDGPGIAIPGAERREGRVRGPLHGIPVVVKDNNQRRRDTPRRARWRWEGFIAPGSLSWTLREGGGADSWEGN